MRQKKNTTFLSINILEDAIMFLVVLFPDSLPFFLFLKPTFQIYMQTTSLYLLDVQGSFILEKYFVTDYISLWLKLFFIIQVHPNFQTIYKVAVLCESYFVLRGAPQGSKLGPELFYLFFNDLSQCTCDNSADTVIFTDNRYTFNNCG